MIHGIYRQRNPKAFWHLVSVAVSPEIANLEMEEFRKQDKKFGNDEAKVAVQLFDTVFYLPEYISEIKESNPVFN